MKKVILGCTFAASAIAQLGVSAAMAAADAASSKDQARIAFADMGGIRNWRADEGDALFVQSRRGQWYRAELGSSCSGLPFAHTIGFVFEPDGSFDRFSSVVVDGRECQIRSLTRGAGPADEGKSAQAAATDAKPARPKSAADADAGNGDARNDDARIPFAHLGGIENWRAIDDDTLYIEGRNDQWYRAELFGFCPGLQFETAIGFVTQPVGGFDEFSSIVVDGRECRLKSLAESSPPPKKG